MPYQLIVFDFDGTLADSLPWLASIFNELAGQYRFKPVSQAELQLLRSYPASRIMKSLGIPFWQAPRLGREIKRRMTGANDRVRLFEGSQALLAELAQRGVRLALVTSNARANVSRVLGPDNLARFHSLECDVPIRGKPSSFRKVLAASGLQKADLLCIGDELRDLEAARRAGIAFGAVSWGYTDIRALEARAPDLVFREFSDILKVV